MGIKTGDISAGGDVSIAGRDMTHIGGDSWAMPSDWRDDVQAEIDNLELAPNTRSALDKRLEQIEEELAKDEPVVDTLRWLIRIVASLAPSVAELLMNMMPVLYKGGSK